MAGLVAAQAGDLALGVGGLATRDVGDPRRQRTMLTGESFKLIGVGQKVAGDGFGFVFGHGDVVTRGGDMAARRAESDTSSNARPDTADDDTVWPESAQ